MRLISSIKTPCFPSLAARTRKTACDKILENMPQFFNVDCHYLSLLNYRQCF
ncbi:hypothetical protein AVDCRST_MAG92-517 [uncultured Coleofasciculus sp.]|uniref:Uncharacterized protein n=1 Tax=uncultured Coleofasciculus sp. TaxID=1267456 RepID=A0A6J4HCG5_9CYAN|nr:hypothetical protein AVDCRST_MAG92-517 [uncultured Coleofasciculus sp.]